LTRFRREKHPHQVLGHLPLWRPLIIQVLNYFAQKNTPVIFIGLGDVANELILSTRIRESAIDGVERVILRPHPADADLFLSQENPFLLCNRLLFELGEAPVDW